MWSLPNVNVSIIGKRGKVFGVITIAALAFILVEFGITSVSFLVLAVIFHEFGHYAVARYYGFHVEELHFSLVENYMEWTARSVKPVHQFFIALGGIGGGLSVFLVAGSFAYFGAISLTEFFSTVYIVGFITLINCAPKDGFDGYDLYESVQHHRHNTSEADDVDYTPQRLAWAVYVSIFLVFIIVFPPLA